MVGACRDGCEPGGLCTFAAALFLLRKFKSNPILVMLMTGVVGLVAGLIMG